LPNAIGVATTMQNFSTVAVTWKVVVAVAAWTILAGAKNAIAAPIKKLDETRTSLSPKQLS